MPQAAERWSRLFRRSQGANGADLGQATPESFALLVSERDRITAQLAGLEAARDRLDEVIEYTLNPSGTHSHAPRDAIGAPTQAA